jgi:hypothetical protein
MSRKYVPHKNFHSYMTNGRKRFLSNFTCEEGDCESMERKGNSAVNRFASFDLGNRCENLSTCFQIEKCSYAVYGAFMCYVTRS